MKVRAARAWTKSAPPFVAAVMILLAWEAIVRMLHVQPFLVPRPIEVARAAFAERVLLASAFLNTAEESFAGFCVSALVGVLVAIVLATSRTLERALYPYALVLQTVPIVAIAPLLVLWFGVGTRAVVASAFIVSVFPVITNALAGLRSVDPALRDLFRLYGASRVSRLWRLELPHATPSIATGLRIACGLAVIGAIVGELVAGFAERDAGLGIVVLTASRQLRTDVMFAAIGASALLGVLMFAAVAGGAHLLLRRWHASAR